MRFQPESEEEHTQKLPKQIFLTINPANQSRKQSKHKWNGTEKKPEEEEEVNDENGTVSIGDIIHFIVIGISQPPQSW